MLSRRGATPRPWTMAAVRSGTAPRPWRSISRTAYWPQRRNRAHPVQSWAIFSGIQMCGTIVKPRRTKCDGSCVKAQSVEYPADVPVAFTELASFDALLEMCA